MYPLDCVPDDIILHAWLYALREKMVSGMLPLTVTSDTISAKLNERYAFVIKRHGEAYFVSIRQNVHDGMTSTRDWMTIVNPIVRSQLLAPIRAFETEVRQYVATEPEWRQTLSEFHSLIMSAY